MAEINEKIRYSPSLLELKPNVELTSGHAHHYHQTPTHETIYQPHKFNPSSEIHHPHGQQKYYAETHHEHKPSYKPGSVVNVKHNPVQTIKKVKLIATPGLKHFATHHKIIARNDYQNYLRNRNNENNNNYSEEESEEQPRFEPQVPRQQTLYRRVPKSVHRYAPNVQSYRAF